MNLMKTSKKMASLFLLILIPLIFSSCNITKDGTPQNSLIVTSTAFEHNGMIPDKYTCNGEEINPAITIKNIPENAKSLVLFVDDPDAPVGNWIHWVVYNIPIDGRISEDSKPGEQGLNSWQRTNYGGPCPPSGTHRYFFKVFALNQTLEFEDIPTKKEIVQAMDGLQLARGQIVGLYSKR